MRRLFLIYFLFFGIFADASGNGNQQINLIISVDWEGFSLEDANLEAFRKFREDYPEVKIVHFLNAAYFLQKGADAPSIQKKINSVIRPGDELGLHIHAFETLLEAAGVKYREDYNFWGREKSKPINNVRGHDVPLSIYSESEIRKIVRTSLNILEENGFKNLKSFRAGGWAASPEVLNALVKEGLTIDSSAVPPEIVKNVTGEETPLYSKIVNKLWQQTTVQSDTAYEIKTETGTIVEVPNNFGLADYITGEEVFEKFKVLFDNLDFNSNRPVNIHYGFHEETAAQFIGRVRYAIDKIKEHVQAYRVDINPKSLRELKLTSGSALSCERLF
ncbi:MAG TPA: hypothetical protein VIG33_16395 [Pseudobdellovibrionaceae bacterium]|jgi:hypothetical protein